MAQYALKGKFIIEADLTVRTGMHIGGSSDYAPIGGIDNIVIRDPRSGAPIVPGSSLKGKIRTLLAKVSCGADGPLPDIKEDSEVIKRLFGSAEDKNPLYARLQFEDCFAKQESVDFFAKRDTGTYLGEVKFENTINRGSGVANPRQIERVPAGMKFCFRVVYNIENQNQLAEDFNTFTNGLRLLQLDYLGGHGSRGYGRVKFDNFKVRSLNLETGRLIDDSADNELKKLTDKLAATTLD